MTFINSSSIRLYFVLKLVMFFWGKIEKLNIGCWMHKMPQFLLKSFVK